MATGARRITLDGRHQLLTAQVIDAAGNQGVSNTVTYTLSTTAPVVTEALTFDTGSSATDHITANDALSGTGLASTVVHFTIDGTPIATTVTANAQGAWSFTPSGLTDGAHTIVASQTDAFGNTGSASLTFTLDTTAPSVAITSAGGATNQANQTITGTVDIADAGATVTILDGATVAGTAIVQGNGNWSAPVTLTGGTNSLTARVTDAAGNTATSAAVVRGAPDLVAGSDSGTSSSDNITNATAPSFTVALGSAVAAGDTVELLLGGTSLAHPVVHTVTSADVLSGSVTLAVTAGDLGIDGSKSISAKFSDVAGNSSTSAALSVTLDTSAPVVAISNAGGATNQPVQTISGTVDIADAGATVTILDGATVAGTAIVQGNGNWSQSITLNSGSNVLTAQVIDAAGNQGVSNTVTYTLSTTAPVVTEALTFDTGSSATDHITANDALSGTGLASTVVHFTIDGTPIATTVTANAQGAWSFTPSGLTDGAHTIVASQTDAFGNTGSASLTFTLDTTAPSGGTPDLVAGSDSGTSSSDNITNVTAPSFTVALGSTVARGHGRASVGRDVAGASGGSHRHVCGCVVRQRDAGGDGRGPWGRRQQVDLGEVQ